MFKVQFQGFISTVNYNYKKITTSSGDLVGCVNTSLGSKYTNKHTNVSKWDNMLASCTGPIADKIDSEAGAGALVKAEGYIHEESFKDKTTGNIRYIHKMTITSVEVMSKGQVEAKASESTTANPLANLSKEQLASIPADVLKAMVAS